MENEKMTTKKQINNNQALKNNQATEAELVRGKNGLLCFQIGINRNSQRTTAGKRSQNYTGSGGGTDVSRCVRSIAL
jgi:hypothetical protein